MEGSALIGIAVAAAGMALSQNLRGVSGAARV